MSDLSPARGRGPFSTGECATSELETQLGTAPGQGGVRATFASLASGSPCYKRGCTVSLHTARTGWSLSGYKSPLVIGTAASVTEPWASAEDGFQEHWCYHDSIIGCDASTDTAVTKPSPGATSCRNCQPDRLTTSPYNKLGSKKSIC